MCFTGIDGSGKTTLARILINKLSEQGIESEYLWCGWRQFESILLKPLATITRKLLFRKEKHPMDLDVRIGAVENHFISSFYSNIVLFDYFLSTIAKVRVPLIKGKSVICDRYFYDLIADPALTHKYLSKLIFKLFPKPDFIFFIDLPEEIAYKRKTDVPSVDYLSKRKQSYLDLTRTGIDKERFMIIDGSQELEILQEIILNRVTDILAIKTGGSN